MSNRDGFGSGFWLGTLVGGVVGGIVGASIASQRANRLDGGLDRDRFSSRSGKRPFKASPRSNLDRLEFAKRSLDDKIAALNNEIDSVRSTIGQVPAEEIATPEDSQPDRADGFSRSPLTDPLAE
jgi:hypothetical protein